MDSIFWSPGMTLEALEYLVIQKAYRFYRNNKTVTANSLGISIRTLDSRLEEIEMAAIEEEASQDARKREREAQLIRARGFQTTSQYEIPFNSDKVNAGIRVESIANVAAKSTVSVPQRAEVQEVLPKQTSGGGSRKGR